MHVWALGLSCETPAPATGAVPKSLRRFGRLHRKEFQLVDLLDDLNVRDLHKLVDRCGYHVMRAGQELE